MWVTTWQLRVDYFIGELVVAKRGELSSKKIVKTHFNASLRVMTIQTLSRLQVFQYHENQRLPIPSDKIAEPHIHREPKMFF